MPALRRLAVSNFRTLKKVDAALGPLNFLVGPNEAGKSNFLDVIQFLGDSARLDLPEALRIRGGIERVRFRGNTDSKAISIKVEANVTRYSSDTAPDEYDLRFFSRKVKSGRPSVEDRPTDRSILLRSEQFTFKRTAGRGRRIRVSGDKVEFMDLKGDGQESNQRPLPLRSDSLALSTLTRMPDSQGGDEIRKFAGLFTTFRVFNVDVDKARQPSRAGNSSLGVDASNLAGAMHELSRSDQIWTDFLDDARAMVPGLDNVEFEHVGGAGDAIAVRLRERGLADSTQLWDASFGTIRLLALLALLYDPKPPAITCIEEIDHGLHPHLFDRLVDRLREASQKTQLLVATHSPALVNRLRPEELLVTERAEDGSTRLPAIEPEDIAEMVEAAGGMLQLGELWFSGSLGGVPR